MAIKIKRIYEPFSTSDGYRILVDRLWPRGIKKEEAHADLWLKDVAPSNVLRKWFNHEPDKWAQFLVKYHADLKDSVALKTLISLAEEYKVITLLYGAKDEQHNQAVALKHFISG